VLISHKTVQDRNAATNRNIAYRIMPLSMTLNDLQGHSPIASLSKCGFRATVQKLTRFQLIRASRGLSAIAERLGNEVAV